MTVGDDTKTFNPYDPPEGTSPSGKAELSAEEEVWEWVRASGVDVRIGDIAEPGTKALDLAGRQFASYTEIAKLTQLQRVDLSKSNINRLLGFEQLVELRWLSLARTKVSDLSALAGLPSLEFLDVSYSEVKDVSPLMGLGRLKVLVLRGTAVSDLEVVSKITSLEEVDIKATMVDSISAVRRLPNLKRLIVDQATVDRIRARKRKEKTEQIYLVERITEPGSQRGNSRPATLMVDGDGQRREVTLDYGGEE